MVVANETAFHPMNQIILRHVKTRPFVPHSETAFNYMKVFD